MYKTLQYSRNEPTIISFDGNYREVMSNESGLTYDIFNMPIEFFGTPESGSMNIQTYNTFEQLPSFNVNMYAGHPAAGDIHKLFSMNVLSGLVSQYNPGHMIRRGEFVTMLVKAVKIPIEPPATVRRTVRNAPVVFTFPDVLPERADYPFIMAAYKAGIAGGRQMGMFHPDHSLTREEAICMIMRTLGLSNLGFGFELIAPFVDDESISDWARNEIYAAARIGIIQPDQFGRINPQAPVSKAEAAVIVNRLIEYMRTEMRRDYVENIVEYTF
jgi:hypothetical protein